VDQATLAQGVERFIERHGPFDVILATEHIVFFDAPNQASLEKAYRRQYAMRFQAKMISYASKIFESYTRAQGIKGVVLLESDYYNFPKHQVDLLENLDGYFIGFGEQFVRPVQELKYLSCESFALHTNDRWHDFVVRQRPRLIAMPAFLNEAEFAWHPLSDRNTRWCVLGAKYWARQEARRILKAHGIRLTGEWLAPLVSLLGRLKLRPYGCALSQKTINYLFRNALESAKYAYTCGSGLGYPIRKYFEIPAAGSVLVCMPCNGFQALGFQDKTNALTCLPQNLVEVHHALEQDPGWAQSLADAGRQLVWEKHRTSARAIQLDESFRSILAGRFVGSYWDSGDYCIMEQDDRGQTVRRIQV
jgi:hypothetical protein